MGASIHPGSIELSRLPIHQFLDSGSLNVVFGWGAVRIGELKRRTMPSYGTEAVFPYGVKYCLALYRTCPGSRLLLEDILAVSRAPWITRIYFDY